MRLGLAFRAFFAVLLGRSLPPELSELAAPVPGTPPALPEGRPEPKPEVVVAPPSPPRAPADDEERTQAAAVQVLAVLQAEGRLLDFLSEDIETYSDADVGAAVRDIHKGLRRAVQDHFPYVPVRDESEESAVQVPAGFDPAETRLVGNVVGEPPFTGTLKHRGWRIERVRLPRLPSGRAARIAAPAEVEV